MSGCLRTAIASLLLAALFRPGPAPAAPADPWQVLPLTRNDDDRGRIQDLAISPLDPDRLLAWTAGLLYRSTDGGDSWALVPAQFILAGSPSSPPSLRGLRLDAANSDGAWVAAGDRILRTTDFGRTWRPWGEPAPGDIETFRPVPGDPVALWIAIPSGPGTGFWRTTDGGSTWEPRNAGLASATAWDFAPHPEDPQTLLAGTGDGLARTTDGGASWSWVAVGARARQIRWSADGAIVRAYQGRLVESTDAGLTWTSIPSEARDGRLTYAFDPLDPADILLSNIDFCGGGGGIGYGHLGTTQRTTDGGGTWIREDLTGCLYYETFWNIGGSVKRVGETAWSWMAESHAAPAQLQKSTDGGVSWRNATTGMKELPIQHIAVDGAGIAYVRVDAGGGHESPMRRSTDRGSLWGEVGGWYPFDRSAFVEASLLRPGHLLEGGRGLGTCVDWDYLALSTDLGATWEYCEYCTCGSPYRAAFNHGSGDTLYVWGGYWWGDEVPGSVFLNRSVDGGLDFEVLGESAFVPVAALITPESDSEVFVATHDTVPIVRTTDAGLTWHTRAAGLPLETPVALLMDPANGDHLVCVFGSGIPWESTDRGASWHRLARGLSAGRATPDEIPLPPDLELHRARIVDADWDVTQGQRRVFLATDRGIWASDLGFLGTKLPQIEFDWVRYSRVTGQVLAASRRHGVFALDVPPLGPLEPATSSPRIAGGSAPLSLAPNPFAGSSSIRFGLGRAGSARLEVFDPAGRRVATLVDGRLAAGGHAYSWSGRNDAGRAVAPGVYFVRLTTPERRDTRRIVRLR